MAKVILPALLALGLASSGLLAASPAEARVLCRDGYQIVGREEVPSPFCEDAYLAQVARAYGAKVSDREVQSNRLKRAEICRFIGMIAASGSCARTAPTGFSDL